MYIFTNLILSIAFVFTELSVVFSSIRFDEVEFDDPDKILDESTSNGFVCAHLGEECQITAQCCGVATCVQPSWSETPVCLVPGYKHDERFRKRFFSLHNLRPEDIRYIRDSYNTSQYDFLLTDLTFSAPPLDEVDNGKNAVGDFGRNRSVDLTSAENVTEDAQIMNASLIENYRGNSILPFTNEKLEHYSNNSKESASASNFLEEPGFNKSFSMINSTDLFPIAGFNLKNHFMFLLINNTLDLSDSKSGLKVFYDQIINTDRFKNIVEQLREKMREINEMEININHSITESTLITSTSRETEKNITEKPKSVKTSKWNRVRKFFFHSKKTINNNHTFKSNSHLKNLVDELTSKETSTVNIQENTNGKRLLQSNNPEKQSEKLGFKKLIEDVDKIQEIIDSDSTIQTFHEFQNANGGGLFDFYSINVPITSLADITDETGKTNNSLESVFEDIGDVINTMLMKNENEGKIEHSDLGIKDRIPENKLTLQNSNVFHEIKNNTNNGTMSSPSHFWNKLHFWDKIHFWIDPQNCSTQMERYSKQKSNNNGKPKNSPLNEHFILNLNSKNQEVVTPPQIEQTEKTSESVSYFFSSGSESGSTEELYNNSYIFMVNKQHFEEPVKVSSWKKMMNFFHRKVDPLSLDMNYSDIPERVICDSDKNPCQTEPGSEPDSVKIPRIIKLPEYLMPQVLDKRQRNETDWIFEESEELEEMPIPQKTSNNSFFFFFK